MIKDILLKKEVPPKVIIVKNVEQVDEIIKFLNNHVPLIVNVGKMDIRSGYRMIDFLTGYCFAKDGTYKKIDKLIYRFEI